MSAPPCGGVNATGPGSHVDPRNRNRWQRARHVSSRTDLPAPRHPDPPQGMWARSGWPPPSEHHHQQHRHQGEPTRSTSKKTTKTTGPAEVIRPNLLPGSDMAALHRSTGPLATALATIPEWVENMGHLAHLQNQRPQQRGVATLEMEAEARLAGAVESREQIDLDMLTEYVVTTYARTTSNAAIFRAFETVAASYSRRLDECVRTNADQIHDHLSAQLGEVIGRARTNLEALNLNAEDAIAVGQVDAWQAMKTHREEFQAIRSAAGRLRQRLGFNPQHPVYAELMWLRNPAQVFDRWHDWRTGVRVDPQNPDSPPLRAPWPSVIGAEETAAWFHYLVNTPAAEPWCPSEDQHDKVGGALADLQHREWIEQGSPSKRGRAPSVGGGFS